MIVYICNSILFYCCRHIKLWEDLRKRYELVIQVIHSPDKLCDHDIVSGTFEVVIPQRKVYPLRSYANNNDADQPAHQNQSCYWWHVRTTIIHHPHSLSIFSYCSTLSRVLCRDQDQDSLLVKRRNHNHWFLVNSYPSQLVPESTRTLFGQLVPKSTRTLVNSYPSKLVPFLKHGYYGSVCYLIHLYIVASFHLPLPHHANGKGNHFRPRWDVA